MTMTVTRALRHLFSHINTPATNQTELHSHSFAEDVIYHIGWDAFISCGSHHQLMPDAPLLWTSFNQPVNKLLATLPKLKIPGGKMAARWVRHWRCRLPFCWYVHSILSVYSVIGTGAGIFLFISLTSCFYTCHICDPVISLSNIADLRPKL